MWICIVQFDPWSSLLFTKFQIRVGNNGRHKLMFGTLYIKTNAISCLVLSFVRNIMHNMTGQCPQKSGEILELSSCNYFLVPKMHLKNITFKKIYDEIWKTKLILWWIMPYLKNIVMTAKTSNKANASGLVKFATENTWST